MTEWIKNPNAKALVTAEDGAYGLTASPLPAKSDRLSEIALRAKAATPGPWEHCYQVTDLAYVAILGQSQDNRHHYVRSSGGVVDNGARHDAEFIAHARSDIPWLLTRIAELEAALAAEASRRASGSSDRE